jgi:hypothetical protein
VLEVITDDIPAQAKDLARPATSTDEAGNIVTLAVGRVPAVLARQAERVASEIVPLYLQALSKPVEMTAEGRTRLRLAGESWSASGLPLEDVLACFSDLTGAVTDLILTRARPATRLPINAILGLTNQVTREFFLGVSGARMSRPVRHAERESPNPAADLLAGRRLPADIEAGLAARYVIVVVRHAADLAGTRAVRMIRTAGGDGTFVLSGGTQTVALIPCRGRKDRPRLGEDLDRLFAGKVWIAMAERDRTEIPDGHREAADILDLVCAARREPQVYRLEHVLLEYAVLHEDEASNTLSAVLEPLLSHSALYETLTALVRSDFNRNAAAKNLFIHRSTLDYRIDRIRELTGHDPMTSSGVRMFGIAVTLQAAEPA